jgi:hypothetical protein
VIPDLGPGLEHAIRLLGHQGALGGTGSERSSVSARNATFKRSMKWRGSSARTRGSTAGGAACSSTEIAPLEAEHRRHRHIITAIEHLHDLGDVVPEHRIDSDGLFDSSLEDRDQD